MLVPGLRNTIALDFHLSESTLYWTDVVEDKIYRGKLSENGGETKSGLNSHPRPPSSVGGGRPLFFFERKKSHRAGRSH